LRVGAKPFQKIIFFLYSPLLSAIFGEAILHTFAFFGAWTPSNSSGDFQHC